MAKAPRSDRILSANVRSLEKVVRDAALQANAVTEYRVAGAPGLVLHVFKSGTATWYLHYDVAIGRTRLRRKLKLGRFDSLALADARELAHKHRVAINAGADPIRDSVETKTAITFAELVEERFAKGDPLKPRSERDYRMLLKADILPHIGDLPAEQVGRAHIIAVIDRIANRGAARRADTSRAVMSAVFNFGIDRGLVSGNPASGLRNRHDNRPRDVVLTRDQLLSLWTALCDGTAPMSPATSLIFRLALLTGQRRAEIALTRKADLAGLETNRPVLTITTGRAKNANMQRVPLSPQSAAIARLAAGGSPASPYLFPGPDPAKPIHPRSVSKAMERTRASLGLGQVRFHDLRRTVGSMMTSYGVPQHVRERVLNHGGKRRSSVTESVYSWYEYDDEKRAALELWADALDGLVGREPIEIENYEARLARLRGSQTVRV